METFVKENTWLNFPGLKHGWGNGYVIIPKGHPLHGKHYDELNDIVDVHGGLTYSEYDDNENWVVGFDTAHYDDTLKRWPKKAVEAETQRLKEQLENYNIVFQDKD